MQQLRSLGSKTLENDSDHKALMLIDVDTKDQARMIIPSAFRSEAKIIELHKYSREEMEEYLHH